MAILRHTNWLARRLMATRVLATERMVAHNKIVTNAALEDLVGPCTPRCYSIFRGRGDELGKWLSTLPAEFVLKSAVSAVGRDVCVLRRSGQGYVEPDGFLWTPQRLERRGQSMPPPIFAEEIATAHAELAGLAAYGTLCDLRLHFVGDEFVVGRCRIPTATSRGYGNVGRGALGVCFRVDGRLDVRHPYARIHEAAEVDGKRLDGFVLPNWAQVFAEAKRITELFASPHVGVDGTVDPNGKFIAIEVTLVPDTKWMSPQGTLAFRDAFRRHRKRTGRIEAWLRTRPDMQRWIERRGMSDVWAPGRAATAWGAA